jgi:hypothetical protein
MRNLAIGVLPYFLCSGVMISQAEVRGEISAGDTLIEATSGNTGIALAMVAAIKDNRASRPHSRDKMRNLAIGVVPYFLCSGVDMCT